MVDSERYLDEVARGLSLGHYEADAILLELRQHIEATKDRLQRDGLPRDEAVMAAVSRMGPARQLAHDLMAARRTRRRVVADVGGRLRLAATAFAFALGVAGSVLWSFGAAADEGGHVDVLPTTGVVDNVMAGYIADGIARAKADGAPALIIELNTPGGSLDATQKIVTSILEAPVPVITWVAPQGGRAASAGTFITLAGNLALMAPGTNIGAASPVDSSGQDIGGTLGEKVKNDAIANIRSIAETRGRNVDWAVSTVAAAKSSPASVRPSLSAPSTASPRRSAMCSHSPTGARSRSTGQPTTLDTADAAVSEQGMNPLQQFLHLLSDPNIAFILFTIGFYGLLFELMHPNFVTGIIGGLCADPRVHRVGLPAAQRRRRAPARAIGRAPLPRGERAEPRPAHDRRRRLLRPRGGDLLYGARPGTTRRAGLVADRRRHGDSRRPVRPRRAAGRHPDAADAPPLPVPGFGFKGTAPSGASARSTARSTRMGSVYVAGEEWSARAAGSGPSRAGRRSVWSRRTAWSWSWSRRAGEPDGRAHRGTGAPA